MRIMVYGDSNSWGTPPDGSRVRMAWSVRWPGVMSALLGCTLREDSLPGRTTVFDDPEMLGPAMNGLTHLPVALKTQNPMDLAIIMLGTNDLKARFAPTPEKIAGNIGRLIDTVRETGGGPGPWDSSDPPEIAVIAPGPLGARADDPNWERHEEWKGGRAVSLELASAIADMGKGRDVPVLDAGAHVMKSAIDPIHYDETSHGVLAHAVVDWLAKEFTIT